MEILRKTCGDEGLYENSCKRLCGCGVSCGDRRLLCWSSGAARPGGRETGSGVFEGEAWEQKRAFKAGCVFSGRGDGQEVLFPS